MDRNLQSRAVGRRFDATAVSFGCLRPTAQPISCVVAAVNDNGNCFDVKPHAGNRVVTATSPTQDSGDQDESRPDLTQGNSDLSPLNGGQRRPVRPDELLLEKTSPSKDDDLAEPPPKVALERRQELEQRSHAKTELDRDADLELAAIYREQKRPQDARAAPWTSYQIFPDDEKLLWELEEATLARSLQQFREVSDLASRLRTSEADRELKRSRHDWAVAGSTFVVPG